MNRSDMFKLFADNGFDVKYDNRDVMHNRNNIDHYHFPVSFVKGDIWIWATKDGCVLATLRNGQYANHQSFASFDDAIKSIQPTLSESIDITTNLLKATDDIVERTEIMKSWIEGSGKTKDIYMINWKMPHTLFNITCKYFDSKDIQNIDWFVIFKTTWPLSRSKS
jgi:hypothetical protein